MLSPSWRARCPTAQKRIGSLLAVVRTSIDCRRLGVDPSVVQEWYRLSSPEEHSPSILKAQLVTSPSTAATAWMITRQPIFGIAHGHVTTFTNRTIIQRRMLAERPTGANGAVFASLANRAGHRPSGEGSLSHACPRL